MSPVFETYLKSYAGFSDSEISQITSLAITQHLRRKEFLLREGSVCRYKSFIVSGLLRVFGTDSDGSEHILQFCPEHTWTLDAESYDRQIPSACNIAAVEDTEILLWRKSDFDKLLVEIPLLKTVAEKLISSAVYNSRQRLLTVLSASPEHKYNDFITKFPDLFGRLPLRMIAAYLGISLKTLTRIRHAQLHR